MGFGIIKINKCILERNDKSKCNYAIEVINMSPLRPQVDNYYIQESDIVKEAKALIEKCGVVDITADVKTGLGGGYLGMIDSEYEAIYPYITLYANGNVVMWFDTGNSIDISKKNVQEINEIIRRTILETQN